MAFLIAYLIPVPFAMLEVLVGVEQALVFMMLALVFFQLASVSHSGGMTNTIKPKQHLLLGQSVSST